MQSSHFPSPGSALPEICIVHMAFLHCKSLSASSELSLPSCPCQRALPSHVGPLPKMFPSQFC